MNRWECLKQWLLIWSTLYNFLFTIEHLIYRVWQTIICISRVEELLCIINWINYQNFYTVFWVFHFWEALMFFWGSHSLPWYLSLGKRDVSLNHLRSLSNTSITCPQDHQFQITHIPGISVLGVFLIQPLLNLFLLKFPSLTSNLLSYSWSQNLKW